jgi:hypothetical protein
MLKFVIALGFTLFISGLLYAYAPKVANHGFLHFSGWQWGTVIVIGVLALSCKVVFGK